MGNLCYNNIHVTYFDKNREQKLKISRLLHKELYESNHSIYPEFIDDDDELITEFELESKWVAPLQLFQHLCNKYNVDIIGVAFEFSSGYVEAFELRNQLIHEEEVSQHVLNFVEYEGDPEIISELPNAQDDEFLDIEYPANSDLDRLDLSDKELTDLE